MTTASSLIFVGTYSEPMHLANGRVLESAGRGIHILRHDAVTGTLTEAMPAVPARNPSYLAFAPSRRFLYAVGELKTHAGGFGGTASAFALDRATGALSPLNTVATHGTDPCHLAVVPDGRHLVVANYSSGHVTVLPIRADGSLGDATQVIAHAGASVDPVRQTGPHPHQIVFDAAGTRVFVAELGLDRIVVYRFDPATGRLGPDDPPYVAGPPGAGPRQIVLAPGAATAYVLNELASSVSVLAYDARSGRLAYERTLSTLPEQFTRRSTCAEVQLGRSGRFLYASNRGHDSLAVFSIAAGGDLARLGHVATGGAIPRCFDLDPAGELLAVANQDSDSVVMFRIDQASGALTPTGAVARVGTPVCVRFL